MSVGFDRARSLWLALAVLGAASCSDARQPPQPASFDRPTDVAFVCVRNNELAEVADCDVERTDRALHALVTQSARGEVAAVNLATDRILDNRRDIPGYTFVPTGELPIAIAISPTKPELTYVASYGSRDVRVMRTKVLLGLSTEAGEVQEPISLTVGADGGSFGGTPSDMLLTPDESALIVALSDVGKVARLPLVQCAEGDGDCEPGLIDEDGITFVDLTTAVPATPTAVATDDSYAKTCGEYQRPPLPVAPAPAEPLAATAARPVAIAIDSSCESCGDGRLLIADEALPLLHVLDLAALSAGADPVLAPIATGAISWSRRACRRHFSRRKKRWQRAPRRLRTSCTRSTRSTAACWCSRTTRCSRSTATRAGVSIACRCRAASARRHRSRSRSR
jgi:hypothetical protein